MKIVDIIVCLLLISSFTSYDASHKNNRQKEAVCIHGLGGSEKKLDYYKEHNIIHGNATAFKLQNGRECPLGQGQDIQTFVDHITPEKDYTVIGHSRGGSTAISALGRHNRQNISMLIIDAAPCDMINIIDEYQYKYGLFPLCTRSLKEWALRLYHPHYPKNSTPPVQDIAHIHNKELPVFIVHSHDDTRVNIRSAWENYKAFKQAGFSHIYLCELHQGGHNHNADGPDSHIFKKALNTVYKQHGQQYDPKLAILKDHDLQQLQPSIEIIEQKLQHNQGKLRQQATINIGICALVALGITVLRKK